MKIFFVTGTDTEVGKTYVSRQILEQVNSLGKSTIGIKLIASGCEENNGKLTNDDALQLQKAASATLPYKDVNPFSFEPAIAPHIAAEKMNQPLAKDQVKQKIQGLIEKYNQHDFMLIEGAGGWLLPLSNQQFLYSIIVELNIPIILVCGLKVGCINHALLTSAHINNSQGVLAGWVANTIDPTMRYIDENIQTIQDHIQAPFLGSVFYQNGSSLNMSNLLKVP
ncbi:dethiobiotin synthase [Francisellaceae bacterium]|nr:dethiobiotin synthase [Francisellaceae bacterium]